MNTDEVKDLRAAQVGDQEAFEGLTEPYRRELFVYCYRLLGSVQDAEDVVQETWLRAWRRLETFQHHVSFRAWLYKIATHVCLDTLEKRPRRTLPAVAYPVSDPRGLIASPIEDPVWLEPFPDKWLADEAANPEARYLMQESITLAFLVALQLLPPRQRAVLLLCEVLDWRASEVAQLLGLTISAVNSALHRARTTMAKHYRVDGHEALQLKPEDEAIRKLLNACVQAWENGNLAAVIAPRQLIKASSYLKEVEANLGSLADRPTLIVWGLKDFAFREAERARFERIFARHQTVLLDDASHFLQEGAGERNAALFRAFRSQVM